MTLTFLDVCKKAPCMVTTFLKDLFQYILVTHRYKTCRKTSMDKWNGGHLGCCLGYHGNRQDDNGLPSLKINSDIPRHNPTKKRSGQKMHRHNSRDCTKISYTTI